MGYNKLVNLLGQINQLQVNQKESHRYENTHVYQETLDDGRIIRIYEPEISSSDSGPSFGHNIANAAIEFALQPHDVPTSGGGGGSTSEDEDNEKENKNNKPRKFRRR